MPIKKNLTKRPNRPKKSKQY